MSLQHLQYYSDFVNEYYQPAPLSDGMVRLYRGDSNKINDFLHDKFDNRAIFGTGLYLTDNRHIAFTYTTKGDDSKILYTGSTIESSSKAIKLAFVVYHLMHVLAGKSTPQYDTKEYKDCEDYYESKTAPKTRKSDITKYNRLEKQYGAMFDMAMAHLKEFKYKYGFIMSHSRYGYYTWNVVDKTAKGGHISEFDIPQGMIDNCYDGDAPIQPDVLDILERGYTRYYKNQYDKQGKALPVMQPIQWYINRQRPSDESIDTLGNIIANWHMAWSNEDWQFFHSEMQILGYTGIKYQGGIYTGTHTKHNAYVLWDLSRVVRLG